MQGCKVLTLEEKSGKGELETHTHYRLVLLMLKCRQQDNTWLSKFPWLFIRFLIASYMIIYNPFIWSTSHALSNEQNDFLENREAFGIAIFFKQHLFQNTSTRFLI